MKANRIGEDLADETQVDGARLAGWLVYMGDDRGLGEYFRLRFKCGIQKYGAALRNDRTYAVVNPHTRECEGVSFRDEYHGRILKPYVLYCLCPLVNPTDRKKLNCRADKSGSIDRVH